MELTAETRSGGYFEPSAVMEKYQCESVAPAGNWIIILKGFISKLCLIEARMYLPLCALSAILLLHFGNDLLPVGAREFKNDQKWADFGNELVQKAAVLWVKYQWSLTHFIGVWQRFGSKIDLIRWLVIT